MLACEIFGQVSIPGISGGTFPIQTSPFPVNLVIEGMEIKIKIGKLPLGSEIQQYSPEMEANVHRRRQICVGRVRDPILGLAISKIAGI